MTNKRKWRTAKQINEMALRMCTFRSDGSKRSLPTIEQAQEYDEIIDTLFACYMGYQGELTDDEVCVEDIDIALARVIINLAEKN